MAKLTKKDRTTIENTLYDIERFLQWVRLEEIQIHRAPFGAINKQCGSPLQFVENALDKLKRLHAQQFTT